MKAAIGKRLNYGNVVATIALFAALSGVAVAATLPKNSVGPNQIKRGAVNAQKLKRAAVTTGKIRNGAVTAAGLADGAVTAEKLAAGVPPIQTVAPAGLGQRGTFEVGGDTTIARGAISFPLSLSASVFRQVVEKGEIGAGCMGHRTVDGLEEVLSSPGSFCVYVVESDGASPALSLTPGTASSLGQGITATFGSADPANRIFGYWSVTPR